MKINKVHLTFCLMGFLMLCLTHPCFSQSVEDQLDHLFKAQYEHKRGGADVLIAKHGQIIYHKQFGLANIECEVPVHPETRFQIGSITKQFTAAAILLLEAEGKLKLSDKIGQYLADFPERKYPITIQQLLTHTSGLRDYPRIKAVRNVLRNNLSPKDILTLVRQETLAFKPGTQSSYSNTGYLVLGLIIEKKSGVPYGEFLTENIFEPLGMEHTQVSNHQDIVMDRATGYTENQEGKLINATYHSSSYAAGAIVSTANDLQKWIAALDHKKVLKEASLAKMFQNQRLLDGSQINMGYGWELNEISGLPSFEHSGFEPGFKANSIYLPAEALYVVVLQNSEVSSPIPCSIQAAAICLGKPYPNSDQMENWSKEILDKFTGTYQFEQGERRIIGIRDGKLYYKAPGGLAKSIHVLNETTLCFEGGYRQLIFTENERNEFEGFLYKNRVQKIKAIRISTEVPEEKQASSVPVNILERYVGNYQSEQFKMAITLYNGSLFAQPEGADKLPLVPEANNKFFIKEIGAEIEFESDEIDQVKTILILLEGHQMKGVKIN